MAQAVSAIGEEHASEQDKDSVIAERGTPRTPNTVLSVLHLSITKEH